MFSFEQSNTWLKVVYTDKNVSVCMNGFSLGSEKDPEWLNKEFPAIQKQLKQSHSKALKEFKAKEKIRLSYPNQF